MNDITFVPKGEGMTGWQQVQEDVMNEALTAEDKKAVQAISDYVNNFIDTRFPNGVDGDIRTILAECILDAFYDGARWSEQTAADESVIIQP